MIDWPERLYARSVSMARVTGATVRRLRPESGEAFLQLDGTHAMFCGPDSPVTQAGGTFTAEHLDAVREFYRGRCESFEAVVTPRADGEAVQRLLDLKPKFMNWESVLVHTFGDSLPETGVLEGATIELTSPADLDSWSEIAVKGFFGDVDNEMTRDLSRLMESMPDTRRYIARWNGEPAAAASLYVAEGVAFLGGMATFPEFRRRGLQGAIIARRLRDAQGCEFATMGALPGGSSERNAYRAGFRLAYTQMSLSVPVDP